jgi:hypothetical protein
MKAMKAIQRKQFEQPPLLPNADSFYYRDPDRLHYERPGFEKAINAWRALGDPDLERRRNPPHGRVNDSAIQRELLRDANLGRINRGLERFYQDELRRLRGFPR